MTNETEAPERREADRIADFLCGAAPNDDGIWYNDMAQTERGSFWWRKPLREMQALQAARIAELEERYLAIAGDKIDMRGRVAELEAERDALASRCRMIVSHATAGKTDGAGMSINDVCVQITALRNVLWNSAKKAGAKAAEAKLAKATEHAFKEGLRYSINVKISDEHDVQTAWDWSKLKQKTLPEIQTGTKENDT